MVQFSLSVLHADLQMIGEIEILGVGLPIDYCIVGNQKNGIEIVAAHPGKMPVMQRIIVVWFARKEQVIFPEFACLFKLRLPVVGLAVDAYRIGELVKVQIAAGV
jgi:hypothetical protein